MVEPVSKFKCIRLLDNCFLSVSQPNRICLGEVGIVNIFSLLHLHLVACVTEFLMTEFKKINDVFQKERVIFAS